MQETKLEQLRKLISGKRSKDYYATRLGVNVVEIDKLLEQLREGKTTREYQEELKHKKVQDKLTEDTWFSSYSTDYNLDKGEVSVFGYWQHEPTPDEIIAAHKIDVTQWKLSQFWSKQKSKGFQVSALFTKLSQKEDFHQRFLDFLQEYDSPHIPIVSPKKSYPFPNTCLIYNKQDSHLNKYDIEGDNDIQNRFSTIEEKTEKILKKACLATNLQKVIYIIGSDEFNSEWTSMTTKGTPQQNILPYHVSFELICKHEVAIISKLLQYSKEVEVVYCPGNHDEYVGWHMMSWLKVYFRNQENLSVDITPDYTKYLKYSNTALCINHSDAQKPERLAQNFPIEFREHWSSCDHYYIFSGDKHTELTRSIGGIKFYQIPALSTSKSRWDSKNGYATSKPEMTAFLIEENNGMTDIYKELI